MRFGRVPIAIVAVTALLSADANAQVPEPAPVPVGERIPPAGATPSPGGSRVVLLGSDGTVLSSASFVIRNLSTGSQTIVSTDASGQAALPRLAQGRYRVTTRLPGRPESTNDVTIPPGGSALALFSGGPVPAPEPVPVPASIPIGEPSPPGGGGSSVPTPTAGTSSASGDRDALVLDRISVAERTFTGDLALHAWLQSQRTERLEAVIPRSAGKSLFVLRSHSTASSPTYSVFFAAELFSAETLEARLALHPGRRLLGVHLIGPSAYLLVFANEP